MGGHTHTSNSCLRDFCKNPQFWTIIVISQKNESNKSSNAEIFGCVPTKQNKTRQNKTKRNKRLLQSLVNHFRIFLLEHQSYGIFIVDH